MHSLVPLEPVENILFTQPLTTALLTAFENFNLLLGMLLACQVASQD